MSLRKIIDPRTLDNVDGIITFILTVHEQQTYNAPDLFFSCLQLCRKHNLDPEEMCRKLIIADKEMIDILRHAITYWSFEEKKEIKNFLDKISILL